MQYEIVGYQVFKVEEVKTKKQTAIVKMHYDFVYHTRLSHENGKVIAEVYDWQGNPSDDYDGTIIFEFEGQTIDVQAIDGKATIDFDVEEAGEYTVRTVNQYMRNGEVTFYAEPTQ